MKNGNDRERSRRLRALLETSSTNVLRDIQFEQDLTSDRVSLEVPIEDTAEPTSFRPTEANVASWRTTESLARPAAGWEPKLLSVLVPRAIQAVRPGKTDPDTFGGDAAKVLKQARLDRHVAMTCVLICGGCGQPGLIVETVDG